MIGTEVRVFFAAGKGFGGLHVEKMRVENLFGVREGPAESLAHGGDALGVARVEPAHGFDIAHGAVKAWILSDHARIGRKGHHRGGGARGLKKRTVGNSSHRFLL